MPPTPPRTSAPTTGRTRTAANRPARRVAVPALAGREAGSAWRRLVVPIGPPPRTGAGPEAPRDSVVQCGQRGNAPLRHGLLRHVARQHLCSSLGSAEPSFGTCGGIAAAMAALSDLACGLFASRFRDPVTAVGTGQRRHR